jgi:hypothetical protein
MNKRDPFRIELRSAGLCMELDCNTIFDTAQYPNCPACGSIEFYPLETWLNRGRDEQLRAGRRIWGAHVGLRQVMRRERAANVGGSMPDQPIRIQPRSATR